MKVWRSDKFGFPQYSVSISSKSEDGHRANEYKQVQFRKGVELENGDEIYIDEAFPTLRFWKDKQTGETRHKEVWMITKWSYRAQYEQTPEPAPIQRDPAPEMQTKLDLSPLPPDLFSAAEDDIPF